MDEFSLINSYFASASGSIRRDDVPLGIGDDCALLNVDPAVELAVSVDTLLAGVHFPSHSPADLIAKRALAVAVSDLSAMGAKPKCFTLAVSLTETLANAAWLTKFSEGLCWAADRWDCPLVGGDTTRGESLSLSVQVFGEVPRGEALLRGSAQVGDRVFVGGPLGDAAAALAYLEQRLDVDDPSLAAFLMQRFYVPEPQIDLGQHLRGIASAAIDVSDGLLADLGHICRASQASAHIDCGLIPLNSRLLMAVPRPQLLQWALSGGDDYQLCFTVPPAGLGQLQALIDAGHICVYPVGEIIPLGRQVVSVTGAEGLDLSAKGYRHFG